ncbi:MAG: DMT family transporter [Candidatus Zixiibacteriota bacterium]
MDLLGELAALSTAFCWAGGTLLFTIAGRNIGSYNVNKLRIPVAAIFLALFLIFAYSTLFPTGTDTRAIVYLTLSGLIGLVLGDTCYFRCLVILGPRHGALMQSLAPPMTAIAAFFLLGEYLSLMAIVGIGITLFGVGWVSTDKKDSRIDNREGSKLVGILMGIGGAAGQALGLVLAKEGMGESFNPLSATFIRMFSSAIIIWIFAGFRGELISTFRAITSRKVIYALVGAAFLGPTIGVWMSLVAVKHTQAGIAATIMSSFPVVVILLVMIFYKERPTPRSVLGAVIAVIGVAMLFIE